MCSYYQPQLAKLSVGWPDTQSGILCKGHTWTIPQISVIHDIHPIQSSFKILLNHSLYNHFYAQSFDAEMANTNKSFPKIHRIFYLQSDKINGSRVHRQICQGIELKSNYIFGYDLWGYFAVIAAEREWHYTLSTPYSGGQGGLMLTYRVLLSSAMIL